MQHLRIKNVLYPIFTQHIELKIYKTGKGSIQFLFNQPMPLELITKIVNFRIAENKAKSIKAK